MYNASSLLHWVKITNITIVKVQSFFSYEATRGENLAIYERVPLMRVSYIDYT